MMVNLLVDDNGRVWETGAPEIARRLRVIGSEGNVATDAVNKLGFVHVRATPRVYAVSLRSQLVSRLAMIGTLDLIFRDRPDRVFVQAVGSDRWEFFTDIERAIHRIEELAGRRPPRPLYLFKPLSLDGLSSTFYGRVESLLRLWNSVDGRWHPEHQSALCEMNLLDHTRICQADRGKRDFVVWQWGKKLDIAGSDWVQVAVGRSLHTFPIPVIASGVVAAHREAAADGRPCAGEVHLVVADGKDAVFRHRYDRLLLPWRRPAGGTVVTAVYLKHRTQVLREGASAA